MPGGLPLAPTSCLGDSPHFLQASDWNPGNASQPLPSDAESYTQPQQASHHTWAHSPAQGPRLASLLGVGMSTEALQISHRTLMF